MMESPQIELKSVTLNQVKCTYSPLQAPLQIQIEYTILNNFNNNNNNNNNTNSIIITNPQWIVEFIADIAHEKRRVALISSISHTINNAPVVELKLGEIYVLNVNLDILDVSKIEEKYLLQVGLLRLVLLSNEVEVGNVGFVVQVKKNDNGELMRMIMNAME